MLSRHPISHKCSIYLSRHHALDAHTPNFHSAANSSHVTDVTWFLIWQHTTTRCTTLQHTATQTYNMLLQKSGINQESWFLIFPVKIWLFLVHFYVNFPRDFFFPAGLPKNFRPVWGMSRLFVTNVNESCHIFVWIVCCHTWAMSHVTLVNESWHTRECNIGNESCDTYEWVMSHMWMSHIYIYMYIYRYVYINVYIYICTYI